MDKEEFLSREEVGGYRREELLAAGITFDDMVILARSEGVSLSLLAEWLEAGQPKPTKRPRWFGVASVSRRKSCGHPPR